MIFAGALAGHLQGEIAGKLVNSVIGAFLTIILILVGVFVYQYTIYPVVALTKYEAVKALPASMLQIIFWPDRSPFYESRQNSKQFNVGVKVNDLALGVEDVRLRLEKLEPNPEHVPLLEFREMVLPFSEFYRETNIQEGRSVDIRPAQTVYFQVILTHGGKFGAELRFFPLSYSGIDSGTYLLGLRATGKGVGSAYAEFRLLIQSDGQLTFDKV